jgi:putative tryptophan/tyrosine transport system substrate-binding protein
MRRREFITLLASGVVAWPVIGFLHVAAPQSYAPFVAAFRRGLGEMGFVEGRNLAIEFRWAQDQYERLPELAADLVRLCLDACQFELDSPTASTGEHTDDTSCRYEFAQQFKPLGDERFGELSEPCYISTRRLKLATSPSRTGSPPVAKTIGMVAVAALAAIAAGAPLTAIITAT